MSLSTGRSVGLSLCGAIKMSTQSRKKKKKAAKTTVRWGPFMVMSGFNQSELEKWRVPRFGLVSSGDVGGIENWPAAFI